jgi:hypothetical protein
LSKLNADKHAAQVASETLQQIEHENAVKTLGLRFLDNRFERYVRSAVVEAARESNLQKIGGLREVLLQSLGLGFVVGSHDMFYHERPSYAEFAIELPNFGLAALVGKGLTIARSVRKNWKKLLYLGGHWQMNLPKTFESFDPAQPDAPTGPTWRDLPFR